MTTAVINRPMPTSATERQQLWTQIKERSPQLAADLAALRAQFPGTAVTSIEFEGVRYGPPEEKNVYVLDDSFLLRLSPADRQKFYYDVINPPSVLEAAAHAKAKKGKKK